MYNIEIHSMCHGLLFPLDSLFMTDVYVASHIQREKNLGAITFLGLSHSLVYLKPLAKTIISQLLILQSVPL